MADCPFCFPDATRIFHAGPLVLGLWDGFPVAPGHALLIPRRHVTGWFEATPEERAELTAALDLARAAILKVHRPDGFNIGVNVGAAAGQTVAHLHVHVIPRYAGDVPDPRGGVRHVIPANARYPADAGGEGFVRDTGAGAAPGAWTGDKGTAVLAQIGSGQAEIVRAIRTFREQVAGDPSEPLCRARARNSDRYERLLKLVEWKLIQMPLPRLQVVGQVQTEFLYRIGWDTRVQRQDVEAGEFDDRIYLREGVAEHIVRLSGLLRPLIERAWATMIARMNRDATDEARLMEFLFGARRVALDPVRGDLRELQNNRCFYCERAIAGAAEVDHFIPWARHPDNGIENLVVADPTCNNSKRDFLAAGDHVQHWAARFAPGAAVATPLAAIAARAGWDHHPQRTFNAARTIYLRLPEDVRLWVGRRDFVTVGEQRERLTTALA
jgi:ATP adenylyltransferase